MTHAPHDFALVIGIQHYPNWGKRGNSLQGPIADAEAFAAWLRADDGGGLRPEHVRLVTSTLTPLAPLQHEIDAQLAWINSTIKGLPARRRFYFYFGGHGHIRLGQGNDALTLCLPNWSLETPGAALHLQSYINASLGCFGFKEAVYFLDCCRIDQAAPLGKTCDWECPSPQLAGRHYATGYAAEPFKLGYEGAVGLGEIRGYFSSALLDILRRGPISLPDLKERLEELVPVLSGNKQFPRIPYDIPAKEARAMIFGPPTNLPSASPQPSVSLPPSVPPQPPAPPPPSVPPQPSAQPTFRLTVKPRTDLKRDIRRNEKPAPAPGVITVSDSERRRVAAARGELDETLPGGSYFIRIEHGDAAFEEAIELDQDLNLERELPRRQSAAPLSSTVDSHEWLSEPAYAMSRRGDVREGEAAIFFFARNPQGNQEVRLGHEFILIDDYSKPYRPVTPRSLIQNVRPGTHHLVYDPTGEELTLPIPVAPGWDTMVFSVVVDGRPALERATVLMQEAGLGFNSTDALLDAYERTLVDLVSGRDIDEDLLEDLLWGKYRNPLFGLVGAHFLLRRLATDPSDPMLNQMAETVIRNLSQLLGQESPDIQALQILQDQALKHEIRDVKVSRPPLLRPALLAMFSASASRPQLLDSMPSLNEMALNAVIESPWNCWRGGRQRISVSGSAQYNAPAAIELRIGNVPLDKVEFARRVLERDEFSVTVDGSPEYDSYEVKGNRSLRSAYEDLNLTPFRDILEVPSWIVEHFVDELERAQRLGLSLDLVQHTRRSALPISLVKAAVQAAEIQLQMGSRESTNAAVDSNGGREAEGEARR
jgi:hypothetical protein